MSERFSGTEEVLGQQSNLAERLQAHPQLQQRISALLDVVENRQSDAHKADQAEQKVIEELRQIGQQALQSWAETQLQKQTEQLRHSQPRVRQHRKKNSTGTPVLGK